MTEARTALVLFSHGSVLCGAGRALEQHVARLRRIADSGNGTAGQFAIVEAGYLNYSSPTFDDAVTRCVDAGATQIVVVPYFLVSGKFVRIDLPPRIDAARKRWPDVTIIEARALDDSPELIDSWMELASHARSPERWRDDLDSAPLFCSASPECPLFATPDCPRGPNAATAFRPDVPTNPGAELPRPIESHPDSDALLVLIHGSPDGEANRAVYTMTERLRTRRTWAHIAVGHLECNAPDIPAAVQECVRALQPLVRAGKQARIIAIPHFLHSGRHLAADIPRLLGGERARSAGIEILMSSYVGTSEHVTRLLLVRAAEALAAHPSAPSPHLPEI